VTPSVDTARIPMQVSRGCVVASIQVALTDAVLQGFRRDLLERVHACGARGVILDVAGVDVLDSWDFEALRRTMIMAEVMGAFPVVSGMRPGVVSALVDLDVDIDGLRAARNLDGAFALLEQATAEAQAEEAAPEDDDAEPASAAADADSGPPDERADAGE